MTNNFSPTKAGANTQKLSKEEYAQNKKASNKPILCFVNKEPFLY